MPFLEPMGVNELGGQCRWEASCPCFMQQHVPAWKVPDRQPSVGRLESGGNKSEDMKSPTLRINGSSYGGVWPGIAGFWDLQTTSFEIPWFLGNEISSFEHVLTNIQMVWKSQMFWQIFGNHKCNGNEARWWFQIFFMFTPKLGEDFHPFWRAYFWNGLVQPPTRKHECLEVQIGWYRLLDPRDPITLSDQEWGV